MKKSASYEHPTARQWEKWLYKNNISEDMQVDWCNFKNVYEAKRYTRKNIYNNRAVPHAIVFCTMAHHFAKTDLEKENIDKINEIVRLEHNEQTKVTHSLLFSIASQMLLDKGLLNKINREIEMFSNE